VGMAWISLSLSLFLSLPVRGTLFVSLPKGSELVCDERLDLVCRDGKSHVGCNTIHKPRSHFHRLGLLYIDMSDRCSHRVHGGHSPFWHAVSDMLVLCLWLIPQLGIAVAMLAGFTGLCPQGLDMSVQIHAPGQGTHT
jgi:hypothetical protein